MSDGSYTNVKSDDFVEPKEKLHQKTGHPNNNLIISRALPRGKFKYYESDNHFAIDLINCSFDKQIKLADQFENQDCYTLYINTAAEKVIANNATGDKFEFGTDWENSILISSSDAGIKVELPANTVVQIVRITVCKKYFNVLLIEAGIDNVLQNKYKIVKGSLLYSFVNLTPELLFLTRDLLNIDLPNHVTSIFYEGRVKRLLSRLVNSLKQNDTYEKTRLNFKDVLTVVKTKEHVENDDCQIPSVEEFSRLCHMSKTKCGKIFMQIYDKPYSIYFMEAKMEFACRLLYQGLSIFEIGKSLGYKNVSRFTNAFKNYYKTTPKNFQLKIFGKT